MDCVAVCEGSLGVPMNHLAESSLDAWFVTDGVFAAGPMGFDRLAVDVARGRISCASYVRHATWSIWQRYDQLSALSADARSRTVQRFALISRSAEARATDPASVPPPPLEGGPPTRQSTPAPISTGRPAAVNPVGVLARAEDMDAAIHLALSTAVAAARADAGLVHRYRRDLGRFVTSHAMGDRGEEQLGNRLAETDPSVLTALHGKTLLVESPPGAAGRHVAGRFAPILGDVAGAAMVPLAVFGKIHCMVEVGRRSDAFYAREVARVEDVVEALAARAVVAGWV
jgi:hypothetical protein